MSDTHSPADTTPPTELPGTLNLNSCPGTSPTAAEPSSSSSHATSPPKKPTTPRKTVTFSENHETRTLPPTATPVSSSVPKSRRLSLPLQPRTTMPASRQSSLGSSLSALSEPQFLWDGHGDSDHEEDEREPPRRYVPDDGDMFVFEAENDLQLPESVAPPLTSPPPGLEEDTDKVADEDDFDAQDEGSEARDSLMPLENSYLAAVNIPLPADHPGFEKKKTPVELGRSYVAGSLGSYKGRPLMMPVVRDAAVEERARGLGDVNTFVGSINGRSGVDEADVASYRASLAAGASYMGSLGGSLMEGMSWVGTPRSFGARPEGVPEREWVEQQRREFLVKRQQERQQERSRAVNKE